VGIYNTFMSFLLTMNAFILFTCICQNLMLRSFALSVSHIFLCMSKSLLSLVRCIRLKGHFQPVTLLPSSATFQGLWRCRMLSIY